MKIFFVSHYCVKHINGIRTDYFNAIRRAGISMLESSERIMQSIIANLLFGDTILL